MKSMVPCRKIRRSEFKSRPRKPRPGTPKFFLERLEPRVLLSAAPLSFAAAAAADLTLKLVDQNNTPTIELIDGSSGSTPVVVARQALADTSRVNITGSAQTDALTIDLSGGDLGPLPVTYSGNGGQDSVRILGNGSTTTSYTPSTTDSTGGTIDGDGTPITFTGVTPVLVGNVSSFTFHGSAGDDDLALTSPAAGQLTVSGTLNGSGFEAVTLQSFQANPGITIDTGTGSDTVTIGPGAVSLPLAGGSLTIAGGQSLSLTSAGGAALDTQGGTLNITAFASDGSVLGNPSAQVTLTDAVLNAGNVDISATSIWNPVDTSGLFGVSLIAGGSTALVDVAGTSEIAAGGTLTIAALSTVSTTAEPAAQAVGSSFDAAAATSIVDSTAGAGVGGSSNLVATGAFALSAVNLLTVATIADASGGSAGAGVAVATVGTTTTASLSDGASVSASSVEVSASSTDAVTTMARSSPGGSSSNTPATQNDLSSNDASTSDGGVGVAAAVAITNFSDSTQALITTSGPVTSSGLIRVEATSAPSVTTTADGTPTGSTSGTVGAAVAIGVSHVTNYAYLGGSADLSAPGGIFVTAGVYSGDFDTEATAGIGDPSSVGVAGALAINVATVDNQAFLESGSGVNVNGADVTFDAETGTQSTAKAVPAQSGGTTDVGVGASVALNVVNATTHADLRDSGNLTGARNLTLTAVAADTVGTDARSTAQGGTAVTPVAAISIGNDETMALIGTGDPLSLGGALSATAQYSGDVKTTAEGSATGADVGVGAALALNVDQEETKATTARNLLVAGAVLFAAQTALATDVEATASTRGGEKDGSQSQSVNQKGAKQRALGDAQAAAHGAKGSGGADANGDASTADGPVSVAGAIALNVTDSHNSAAISDGVTVSAGSTLTLSAKNDTDARAAADGSQADKSSDGVGAAVALNVATVTNDAAIGNATVSAGAIALEALTANSNGGDGTQAFDAQAVSGAGAGNVGVAGALALNVISTENGAAIAAGASLTDHGPVTLTADDTMSATAGATPSLSGGDLGVGGGVALNIASVTTTAALENGAALTGATDLTLSAHSQRTMSTTAETGAAGTTAVAGGVALAIPTGATEAVIGTGPALTLSGTLMLDAKRTTATTTTSSGAAVGNDAGAGVSFAITVADETARASVARDVTTAGDADLTGAIHGTSNATALAGAQGAPDGSTPADGVIDGWIASAQAKGWLPNPFKIPSSITPDGSVGAAAAIAVNVGLPHAEARVLAGSTLAIGGGLSLQATTLYDAQAVADASAVSNAGATLAVAVAIDVARPSAEATIAGSVAAGSVAVTATVDGVTNASAFSGNGVTDVGVAGAFAINVANADSRAAVEAGASVSATDPGGEVTIHAIAIPVDTAIASGITGTFAGIGVGASVAVNVGLNSATAEVAGTVNSLHNVTVLAEGTYTADTEVEGGATGGTAIAPAIALQLTGNDTASLADAGALIQAGGALLVESTYSKDAETRTRAQGPATSAWTAAGASIALGIGVDTGSALVSGEVHVTGTTTIVAAMHGVSRADSEAGAQGVPSDGPFAGTTLAALVVYWKASDFLTKDIGLPEAYLPGSIGVAAAVAANVELAQAQAAITGTGVVTSGAALLVSGQSDIDAAAGASGRTVGFGLGIAAAVALNVAGPTTEATIAGQATAPAITVDTLMTGAHAYSAQAQAGAGSALALPVSAAVNVGIGSSAAMIDDGAALTLTGGGTLTVSAAYATDNTADAVVKPTGELTVGLGATLAVNAAHNATHAALGDAAVTGAGAVSVLAAGTHSVETTAQAGAQGQAASGAAVAVGASASQTTAEMTPGTAPLSVSDTVDVAATHTATVTTTADGETAGSDVAAGAAIAASVSLDASTARIGRDLTAGGDVTSSAVSNVTTSAKGIAGQNGGFGSLLVDQDVAFALGLPPSQDTIPTVPSFQDVLDGGSKDTQLALPSTGFAAAVSVDAAQPKTVAEISDNTSVTSTGGTVSVTSSVDNQTSSTADGSAVFNTADAGLAVSGNFAGGTNQAAIGAGARVTAPDILVRAGDAGPQTFTAEAFAGSAGILAGEAGSVAVSAGALTTQALVADNAVLSSGNDVSISAESGLASASSAGGGALGLAAGVGASISGTLIQDLTVASIGNAQVDAGGAIAVTSDATQGLAGAAVAGAVSGLGSVAGSINLTSLVADTEAFTAAGVRINQEVPPNPAQDVLIHAEDDTVIVDAAGVISGALLADGSAVVDGSVIKKNTIAHLAGTVSAGGNVAVEAISNEDDTSVVGNLGISELITIAGSGSIQHLDLTTQAYIDGGADVHAAGTVRLTANESSHIDVTADSASLNFGFGGAAGASIAIGWVNKVTEAYIGSGAVVQADAGLPAITTDSGFFNPVFGPEPGKPGEISSPLGDVAAALSVLSNNLIIQAAKAEISFLLGLVMIVDAPPIDGALTHNRSADAIPVAVQGISVVAETRDDMERLARGLAGSTDGISVSPELSGSAGLVTDRTSAFIAPTAQAISGKTVRVVAGSDTYDMGIGGSASAGGIAAVGAAADLSLFNNVTEAYVAGHVEAQGDVEIQARAEEDILAVAAGLTAGTGLVGANLTASIPVLSLTSATHAFVDSGGFVHSVGNTLIFAEDDTNATLVAGQAAFGSGYGVGASAAVDLISKDTAAYVAGGATVNADGNTADTITVYGGSVSMNSLPTEAIHGLGVQAKSSETTLSVVAAGADTFGYEIAGSVGFLILDSNTNSYIDNGAVVTARNVNVSAVNDAWTFGAAVNLLVSSGLGVAGGIDIGLIRNDTHATIGGEVTTPGDVEVHALSRLKVDSFTGAVGFTPAGVSLVASVGLYSIRANFDPILGIVPLDFLNFGGAGSVQQALDGQILALASTGGGGIGDLLNRYATATGGDQAAADAIAAAAPAAPAESAVQATLGDSGTQARISGGTVNAGGKVEVNGQEVIQAALDASFTFNFDAGNSVGLKNNRAILQTGGEAGGFIDNGAHVTAGTSVSVRGDVANTQQISGDTAVNGTKNKVTAAIDDATVQAQGGDVDVLASSNTQVTYTAILPSHDELLTIKSATSLMASTIDAHISNGAEVTATGDVNVKAGDRGSIFVLSDGATWGHKGFTAAASLVTNDVGDTVSAYVDHSDVSAVGTLVVQALSRQDVESFSIGVAAESGGKFAGAGSYASTDVHNALSAYAQGSTIVAGGDILIQATDQDGGDKTEILSVSGGAALSYGSVALGVAVSKNTIENSISAAILGGQVTSLTGNVNVEAETTAVINALAIGLGAADKFAAEATVAWNVLDSQIDAHVAGGAVVTAHLNAVVRADDESEIHSLAGGAVAGLGAAAVGASFAKNEVGDSDPNRGYVKAFVLESSLSSETGDVQVTATADPQIETAALALGGADSFALGGSVTLNNVHEKVDAAVIAGPAASATVSAQGSVLVGATAHPVMDVAAGGATGSGSAAIGAAVALNDIGDTVKAHVDLASVSAVTGHVQVTADTDAEMSHVVVVGGGGGGTAGVAGSVAVNTFSNDTEASITGGATVTAAGTVAVIAQSRNELDPVIGTLTIGGSLGVGGSVLLDEYADTTTAFISGGATTVIGEGQAALTVPKADGTTDTESTRGVAVIATTDNSLSLVNVNASGGGSASLAATVSVATVGDATHGYIDAATVNPAAGSAQYDAAQSVKVRAAEHTDVDVKAGVVTLAGSLSAGATVDVDLLSNDTQAYVIDGADVNARGDVLVTATSQEDVVPIVISGTFSGVAAVAGNVPVIDVSSTTEAYIETAAVAAGGNLDVVADSDVRLGSRKGGGDVGIIAGAVAIAGGGGLGGSVVVATIDTTTEAHITDSTTNAGGTTDVEADSLERVTAYDITGALGAYLGAAGAVIVTTVKPDTEAFIDGASRVNQDSSFASPSQSVGVQARDDVTITDLAGAAAGGVVGVSAAIDVLTVRNATVAYVGGSAIVSAGGDVTVRATQTRNVSSTVIGFGVGFGGVQGSVSIVDIGSAMSAAGQMYSPDTLNAVNEQMHGAGGTKVDNVGSDPLATSAKARADSATSALDLSEEFDPNAPAARGTSASILGTVSAGGDIHVTATDSTDLSVTAGSGAAGLVGIGAGVALASVGANTEAFIAGSGDVSAGGVITVEADYGLNRVGNTIGQAYAGAFGVGAGSGAIVLVTDDSTQSAYIGGGARVTEALVLNVTATSDRTLLVSTGEVAGGAVAAGAAVADATAGGSTTAAVDGGGNVQVGELSVTASDGTTASSSAAALTAGIITGSGSDAEATVAPTVEAAMGDGSTVNVGGTGGAGTVTVRGEATDHATATATGFSVAAGHVGVSLASATNAADVSAAIGAGAVVNAAGDITIQALSTQTAKSSADASSGSLIGVDGSKADVTITSSVTAEIGAGAAVTSQNGDFFLQAKATNNGNAGASGTTIGILFSAGLDSSNVTVSNLAQAKLDDGATHVGARGDITVDGESTNSLNATASGGSGGFASVQDSEATADLHRNDTYALVGAGNTLNAGGTVAITANQVRTYMNARATSTTYVSGISGDVAKAYTTVENTSTVAAIGAGATVSAYDVRVTADDTQITGPTSSQQSIGAALATADASIDLTLVGLTDGEAYVSVTTLALAVVGAGADVTGAHSVTIAAREDSVSTDSESFAGETGVGGPLTSKAYNTRNTDAQAILQAGAHVTTSNFEMDSIAAVSEFDSDGHPTANAYVRNPVLKAQTLAQAVSTVAKGACEVGGQVVCAWGLVCNPDAVCNAVQQGVQTVTGSTAEQDAGPTNDFATNEIHAAGTITVTGASDLFLDIAPDGTVTSNLPDGWYYDPGRNAVVVNDVAPEPGGTVKLNAPDGGTIDNGAVGHQLAIDYEVAFHVTITNESTGADFRNLILNNIAMTNANTQSLSIIGNTDADDDGDDGSIAGNNQDTDDDLGADFWLTEITNATSMSVFVETDSSANSYILLQGRIENIPGTTTIENLGGGGGDVLATATGLVDSALVDLLADSGTIGTAGQRFNVEIPFVNLPNSQTPGIREAIGATGVYLDVTPLTESDQAANPTYSVNDVFSSQGDVDLLIESTVSLTETLVLTPITITILGQSFTIGFIPTISASLTNVNSTIDWGDVSSAAGDVTIHGAVSGPLHQAGYDFHDGSGPVAGPTNFSATDFALNGTVSAPETVAIEATGSILDGAEGQGEIDIVAATAELVAGGSIGGSGFEMAPNLLGTLPTNPIGTQVSTLGANAAGGGVFIVNRGGLQLGGLGTLFGSDVNGVYASGQIVVVTPDAPVPAGAATDTDEDLSVAPGATVQSTADSISLLAGDNFTLNATAAVSAPLGNIVIQGDYGNETAPGADPDPDFGSTIQINGPTYAVRVDIWGNQDGDTFNLRILPSPTFVFGAAGNDVINVSSEAPTNLGNVDGITGPLTIDGGAGFNTLTIGDIGTAFPKTATQQNTQTSPYVITELSGLAPGPITYYASGGGNYFGGIFIDGGGQGNVFTIAGTQFDTLGVLEITTLNSGQGNDEVPVTEAQPHYLVINGEGGNDRIDAAATETPVTIFGGAGNDTIAGGSGGDVLFGDSGLVQTGLSSLNGQAIVLGTVRNVVDPDLPGSDALSAAGGHNIILGDDGLVTETNGTPASAAFIATANPGLGGGSDSVSSTVTGAAGSDTILGGLGDDTISEAGSFNIILGDLGSVTRTAAGVPALIVTAGSVNLNLGLNSFEVTPIGVPDASFGGGNDVVSCTLPGAAGGDTILGGLGDDEIADAGGHNVILGDDGAVTLTNSGVVTLIQTLDPNLGGNDGIRSDGGNDTLIGGFGNDTIDENGGATTQNVILGDDGAVTLTAGSQLILATTSDPQFGGNDTVNGGAGNDTILGGSGNDLLHGGTQGDNIVVGDNGFVRYAVINGVVRPVRILTTDPYYGGDDVLTGGAGDDVLVGGVGSNFLSSGEGNDLAIGNNAAVTPAYNPDGTRQTTPAGWWERDVLLLDAGTITGSLNFDAPPTTGADAAAATNSLDGTGIALVAGAFNTDGTRHMNPDGTWDTRVLQLSLIPDGSDTLLGGNGNDAFFGGRGNDSISAGNGNDTLVGGLGNDTVTAGSGKDLLVGDDATIWSEGAAGPQVLHGYELAAPAPATGGGVPLSSPGSPIVPLGFSAPGHGYDPLTGALIGATGGAALTPGGNVLTDTAGLTLEVFDSVVTDVAHHLGAATAVGASGLVVGSNGLLAGNDTLTAGTETGGTGGDTLVGDDLTILSPSLTVTSAIETALLQTTRNLIDAGAAFDTFVHAVHSLTADTDPSPDPPSKAVIDHQYYFGNDTLRVLGPGNNVLVGQDMSIDSPTITVAADLVYGLDRAELGLRLAQINLVDGVLELFAAGHDLREVNAGTKQDQAHIDQIFLGNDNLQGGQGSDFLAGGDWTQVAPTFIITEPSGPIPSDPEPSESLGPVKSPSPDPDPMDQIIAGQDTLTAGSGPDVLAGGSVVEVDVFLQAAPGVDSSTLTEVSSEVQDVAEDAAVLEAADDGGSNNGDLFLNTVPADIIIRNAGQNKPVLESGNVRSVLIDWDANFDGFGSAPGVKFPFSHSWMDPIEVPVNGNLGVGDPLFAISLL